MAENTLLIEDVVSRKAFDQLKALELNLNDINAQVLVLVKTFDSLGKAVESANDLRALTAAQQQLNNAQKQAVTVSQKQAAAQEAVSKAVKDSTDRTAALQDALNNTAKSIKEAREQNKLLITTRNATNVSSKEGVERLNQLNAKINQNNAFIKANVEQVQRQKFNIENYAAVLGSLGGSFGGTIRQASGFLNIFKKLPNAIAPFVATLGTAVNAFKLWATTTAKGEEVAQRFRMEIGLIKENFKNNAGFRLSNLIEDDDTPFKNTADALDEINELSKKTNKSFGDWIRMAFIGAAAAEGAYNEYSGSARKALTLEEELKLAIQRTATTDDEYKKRVTQYAKDTYDFQRKNIDNLTVVAALEREITQLQETARDNTKSIEERQVTCMEASAKINALEAIELGMVKEQNRLIQEETELTHTLQYNTLRGIDEVLSKRQEEAELLRGQVAAAKEQEDAVLKVAEASEKLEKVEADIKRLEDLRREASRDMLANDEKAANATVAVFKTEEKFANLRKNFSLLDKNLINEQFTDRKAALRDYTDSLKQELDKQVAAAKTAADEAKGIYTAKGNEGLNQLADVETWIKARHDALDAEQAAEEELTRKTAEKSIEILGLTGEEAVNVTEKMEADLLAIQEKYGIKREALAKDDARQRTEAVTGQLQAEQARITADIQTELDTRQVKLSQALEQGEITYRKYHKAIEANQREALREQLKAAIDYYEKVMAAEGVTDAERRKALSELSRLYQEVGKVDHENKEENPMAWWDNLDFSGKFKAIADAVKQTWDAVNQVVGVAIQSQITELDNEQKRIDKNYEKRLEQVKNMGLSERQQELETARIEKEHEAETEKLEEQKAALQTRQARWNKANSIVQTLIAGSLAVVQAFAQSGPILGAVFAGIIAATTAASVAAIAAQKIPEYKMGRKGGPAELAVVGDGGVSEVIETPSGMAMLTPSTPTLARLSAGDRVYRDVTDYLTAKGGDRTVVGELRAMRRQTDDQTEILRDTMMNINTRLAVTSAGLAWLRGGRRTNGWG